MVGGCKWPMDIQLNLETRLQENYYSKHALSHSFTRDITSRSHKDKTSTTLPLWNSLGYVIIKIILCQINECILLNHFGFPSNLAWLLLMHTTVCVLYEISGLKEKKSYYNPSECNLYSHFLWKAFLESRYFSVWNDATQTSNTNK